MSSANSPADHVTRPPDRRAARSNPGPTRRRRLTWWQRLGALIPVVGAVSVFVVAATLTPDDRGFGTHEQLGLPACRFRVVTGWNCPHCGMTTSFAHLVRGHWSDALHANAAGIPLAAVMGLTATLSAGAVVTGRWAGPSDPMSWLIHGLLAYLVLTVLLWAGQLTFGGF